MNFHNITHDDMNNGDGLRVVLWVAGCDHHCKDCQNPVTWNPDDGVPFTLADKEEIFAALALDYIAGITFSGGDPLHPANRRDVRELMEEVKTRFPDKTIWVYTGYTWEEIMQDSELAGMMTPVDILVDGRFVTELKDVTYPWAGSTNQKVIDVQKTLQEGRIILHESH
jgi:anaerobic ribonucleoside-triphosphate reductase activating protein|nr:MAG TPA: anaerobic ribonucleoside-triphosphate reductase activating protein [Caudoviricetes sp.]